MVKDVPFPPAFSNYVKAMQVEPFGIYAVNSVVTAVAASQAVCQTTPIASNTLDITVSRTLAAAPTSARSAPGRW